MGKHMIPDELHEQMVNIWSEAGPLEAFAQAHSIIDEDGQVE